MVQIWSVTPAAIAGVTLRLLGILPKGLLASAAFRLPPQGSGARPGPEANNPLDGAPARGYMKITGT